MVTNMYMVFYRYESADGELSIMFGLQSIIVKVVHLLNSSSLHLIFIF